MDYSLYPTIINNYVSRITGWKRVRRTATCGERQRHFNENVTSKYLTLRYSFNFGLSTE